MILGTGIDLASVSQLAEQLVLPGTTFVTANLTAMEVRTVRRRCSEELPAEQLADVDALLSGDAGALAADSAPALAVARHVAARWAAKEAAIKAWSAALYGQEPPLAADAVDLREIEVIHDHWKRPALVMHGEVADALVNSLSSVTDRDNPPIWHLSLTHDGDTALAQAILETA